MKKVMLLCASHNDLGLINALRKLGYYIYATGNIPGLIGEKYVDEYIQADYSDKKLILKLAKDLQVDNICACCNDYGVYTAAYVAENLGLSGYDSYATTLTLHNKDKFKQFAAENDIISPAAHSFSQKNEAMAWAKKAKLPLIVKPVDCSAGNGICKVNKAEMIESSVNLAFEKSRAGRVVIEDFIDGTQHGFCTYLLNQKVVAVCSNDEYSFANPYRVEIDTFPATGIERCQNILIEQVEKIAGILHLKDGIFHLQYIEDENGPHIIEVMRRVLGNMYSVPANLLMGFDWDYWEVRARMGLSCDHFPRQVNAEGFFAYKAMLAKENGVITSINIPKQYNKYLIGDCIIRKPGDNITNFASEPIGFLFMRFSSQAEMHKVLIDEYCNNIVQIEKNE